MMPMKAWRLFARKYRVAMKSSKRMEKSSASGFRLSASRIITTARERL
jgi:hypothetical protein